MLGNQVSTAKRVFSDIILTYHKINKKPSTIFFIVLFCTNFFCPVYDLSNSKFIFKDFFTTFGFSSYILDLIILFAASLTHCLYIIYITSSYQNVTLIRFFKSANKLKLLESLLFTFFIFILYSFIYKIFSDFLKFTHLWLYIFLNCLKLSLFYLVNILGILIINDFENLSFDLNQITIKNLVSICLKVLCSISIISLILSPIFYCLQNQMMSAVHFSSKVTISSMSYYVLECLINTCILIVFYNFLGLILYTKNRKMVSIKAFKKVILISLSFMYLFIWFTCGVIYQEIAKESNGRDFIFQEDIKIKLQAKALKDDANLQADEYVLCDLIKNNEFEKEVIHFNKFNNSTNFTSDNSTSIALNITRDFDLNENEGFLCTNKIGKYWAEFYSSEFYQRGISYYRFELNKNITAPKNIGFKNDTLYPITIFLYSPKIRNENLLFPESNRIRLLDSNVNILDYNLISTYTILIDDKSYIDSLKTDQVTSASIHNPMFSSLSNILQHSVLFLGNDYKRINESYNMIETNGVRFPLLDFLYYSAVTITTTGYGDILPNSTIIRTLVMFETFFGVGIPGLFVSLLFFKIEHKGNKIDSTS